MKNIAIIPARSGSKGLPDKNIKLLNGKPLIYYSIEAARQSGCFDEIMVSTDSPKYREIAMELGANVPFLRSLEQSGDMASSWDVVKEVLREYEKIGRVFDTITLLQPTSPLRTAEHIKEGYKLFEEKNANAVIGVVEMEHSPLWANTIPDDGNMIGFASKEIVDKPRQSLPVYYRVNGALYILKTSVLDNITDIYDNKCFAYRMSNECSVDIDTEFDFKIANLFMNN